MKEPFNIHSFQELDSTNAYALREFARLPHGAVVTALRQTAGRGRLGRAWQSEGKGLYFTVVVKPENPASFDFPCLTQLLAVSVCGALEELGLEPRIKWPNDVLLGGAKLCGVLAEAFTEGGKVTGAAVGAGLNLHQQPKDFGELPYPAVSLAMTGRPVPHGPELLAAVLRGFGGRYPYYARHAFAAIAGEYSRRFAFTGRQAVVKGAGGAQAGTVKGVAPDGRLVLETSAGEELFSAGELEPAA